MISTRRFYISNWKMEDIGFSRSVNSKRAERKDLKKRARREMERNHKGDDAWNEHVLS